MKLTKQITHIDGRKITFYETGTGQPLILLPGLGCDCSLWSKMIPGLSDHFHIYAFSLPVYGTRNLRGHRYTFNTLHKLLRKLVKHFGINDPIIVGHSLGAIVSLIYTARHPKSVNKLILVSAPLSDHTQPAPLLWRMGVDFALKSRRSQSIIDYLERHPDTLKHMMQIVLPRRQVGRAVETAEELLHNIPIKAMASCYNDLFTKDFKKYVLRIKVPTMVVHGLLDDINEQFHGTALYPLIRSARIEPLKSRHFIPVDVPSELNKLILEFNNTQ
jgi:pimeloyl-ACP methyl ester carboxylesterase